MSAGARGVFPRSLETPGGGGGRAHRMNGAKKRNKSVAINGNTHPGACCRIPTPLSPPTVPRLPKSRPPCAPETEEKKESISLGI